MVTFITMILQPDLNLFPADLSSCVVFVIQKEFDSYVEKLQKTKIKKN